MTLCCIFLFKVYLFGFRGHSVFTPLVKITNEYEPIVSLSHLTNSFRWFQDSCEGVIVIRVVMVIYSKNLSWGILFAMKKKKVDFTLLSNIGLTSTACTEQFMTNLSTKNVSFETNKAFFFTFGK